MLTERHFGKPEKRGMVILFPELVVDPQPSIGKIVLMEAHITVILTHSLAGMQVTGSCQNLCLSSNTVAQPHRANQGVTIAGTLANRSGHLHKRGRPRLDLNRLPCRNTIPVHVGIGERRIQLELPPVRHQILDGQRQFRQRRQGMKAQCQNSGYP